MGNNKGVQAEISKVQLDGLYRKIPGFATGAYMGDQQILETVETGYTSLFGGATTNINHWLAPCDYKAVAAFVNVDVDPGTAAATISIGTTTATTGILNGYSIATNAALGFTDLSTDTSFTGASLFGLGNQGDIVVFNTNGAATSTGKAIWGIITVVRG